VIAGYHEQDFDFWDARGRLVAQSRQLARLPAARPSPDPQEKGGIDDE
jgi:hypothetical protein